MKHAEQVVENEDWAPWGGAVCGGVVNDVPEPEP